MSAFITNSSYINYQTTTNHNWAYACMGETVAILASIVIHMHVCIVDSIRPTYSNFLLR